MSNFGKNIMGGLLGAFYFMCFAFPAGVYFDLFQKHLSIGQFFLNQLITFLVIWFLCFNVAKWYREALANANKPRSEDPENNNLDNPTAGDKSIKSNASEDTADKSKDTSAANDSKS